MSGLKLWAHRGSHGAGGPLENTRPAFERALAEAADGIELDVHVSADGVPLVFHDETTGRLAAGGEDLVLADEPADRLLALPLRGGETMPTLAWVLDRVAGAMPINVEIKDASALDAVLATLRARPPAPILLSSFSADAMAAARVRAPELPRAYLVETLADDATLAAELDRLDAAAWHPHMGLLTPARIALCRARGVAIHVWTVNDPAQARALATAGVTGVFADRAGALRAALQGA
ncbi:MAG: glycerophosphodiester phosphodiesterase [Myxococcales bacterium]|nr:glycerophosphodiester phosphodiesterase [Myxococcales bacterium]